MAQQHVVVQLRDPLAAAAKEGGNLGAGAVKLVSAFGGSSLGKSAGKMLEDEVYRNVKNEIEKELIEKRGLDAEVRVVPGDLSPEKTTTGRPKSMFQEGVVVGAGSAVGVFGLLWLGWRIFFRRPT